jgi:hypothetical protein
LKTHAENSIQDLILSSKSNKLFDKLHFIDINERQRRLSNLGFLVKNNFVEIRTPLFDYPIIDVIKKIPAKLRKQRYIHYKIFSYLSSDLASIRTTDSMLPINYPHWLTMLGRIKKGAKTRLYKSLNSHFKFDYNRHKLCEWGIDFNYWFKESNVIKEYTREVLLNNSNYRDEYLNKEGVLKILELQFSGKADYSGFIAKILTHMVWKNLFIN